MGLAALFEFLGTDEQKPCLQSRGQHEAEPYKPEPEHQRVFARNEGRHRLPARVGHVAGHEQKRGQKQQFGHRQAEMELLEHAHAVELLGVESHRGEQHRGRAA